MEKKDALKDLVRDKYAGLAVAPKVKVCACRQKEREERSSLEDQYKIQTGYLPEADLSLGCGIPTEHAGIAKGHTVLDLGSGAGNDVFIARSLVGEKGRVMGLDFTPEMVEKAKQNANRLGFENVDFLLGDIEDMPFEDGVFDVIISNCVLNLVPDKKKAYAEIFRVLKPGGQICVSDMVLNGELPEAVRKAGALYAGCLAGALQEEDYLAIIERAGFGAPEVHKKVPHHISDAELLESIKPTELIDFRHSGTRVFSITITAKKPI